MALTAEEKEQRKLEREAKKAERKAAKEAQKASMVAYVESDAASSIVNDDGRLTTHELVNFDDATHKSPKKNDFAAEHLFMLYRADQLDAIAEKSVTRAAQLRKDAEVIAQQPDPTKRAAIKRMARLRDQLAALEAELESEGISLE